MHCWHEVHTTLIEVDNEIRMLDIVYVCSRRHSLTHLNTKLLPVGRKLLSRCCAFLVCPMHSTPDEMTTPTTTKCNRLQQLRLMMALMMLMATELLRVLPESLRDDKVVTILLSSCGYSANTYFLPPAHWRGSPILHRLSTLSLRTNR